MQRYEERSFTRETLVELRCDLCGDAAKNCEWPNRREVTIEMFRSGGHPDCGSDIWEFDCCPSCWNSVIVPLFAAKGAEPRHTES